ncbi:hypothetical protein CDD82_122 [Ophiocordyceps australis]|uniref:Uncharacterized protein n=1 Tax=Ophiocordyceps australis TaxID=1399860 RepID=A0A2C5YND8_9HYPO|nr:hypothetical protein CDD82_122 [Ophiocordyceps australis]
MQDETTEVKVALLASLHGDVDHETLLNLIVAHNGSVSQASLALQSRQAGATKDKASEDKASEDNASGRRQQSLKRYATASDNGHGAKKPNVRWKKGSTLHLYDADDVSQHTPCSIIHNFLPAHEADELLRELLDEAKTFQKSTFKLFDQVVSSRHTSSFYVESYEALQGQKADYYYNGSKLTDVRPITRQLSNVKPVVQMAVNSEMERRIRTRYPGGQKLKHQSGDEWVPNMAFVNCYQGGDESVGWHSDQLTYLGPRAVIGSLSLGVAREFRVRRVCPASGEAAGQIAIHLPHNSLLVMHAEMQEEWKHCVAPAASIDPHPVAGNRRINITYRHYRDYMHPRHTPRCSCAVPCVLRVVQKRPGNQGRYFWMCHAGNVPGKQACCFFQWAEFDCHGKPLLPSEPSACNKKAEAAMEPTRVEPRDG